MDLRYDENQILIQDQAREFIARESPLEQVHEWRRSETPLPGPVWQGMAAMGWLGAILPEDYGGMGLSLTDLSRILEEMGRGLLPGPFLPTLTAAHAVLLGGPQEMRRRILPAVVQGQLHLALARTQEGGRFDAMGGRFFADSTEGGYLLFGEKLAVPGLAEADHIVVAAVLGLPEKIDEGVAFFLIDPKVTGVVIEPLRTLDGGWTQASLRLDAVRVPADRLLGENPGEGPSVNERVSALLDLSLAFDALGGAQHAMETAVEYAKVRTAFGQPIGSYQAIKHKCADMLHAVESLRAIAMWAAWVMDASEPAQDATPALAAAMVRATAIETYDLVIRHATQVLGAIACTEEHVMHLFAKRAKTLSLAFGPLAYYQEIILRENGFEISAGSQGS